MIKVIVEDLETGERESKEFDDDYLLICAGNTYLTHTQHYPTTGTSILTVKIGPRRQDLPDTPDPSEGP